MWELQHQDLAVSWSLPQAAAEPDLTNIFFQFQQNAPSEKGEFTLTSLEAGQYRIEPSMLGEDYFVRSITLPAPAKNQPPELKMLRWPNQNLLAGETGPMADCACPRNTMRARSARLIASEMARRKFAERNQFFL